LFGFDFRYHALSLIAVLIALVVGLLLGVAIGDKGLVSSAETNLRQSLRSQVHHYQDQVSTLQGQLDEQTQIERELYSVGVGGQLSDKRIGVISLGSLPNSIVDNVKAALEGSGGQLHSKSIVDLPLNLNALASKAKGTRYEALSIDPGLVEAFGKRIGIQFTDGGTLLQHVSGPLLTHDTSGELDGMDGVVLYHADPANLDDAQKSTMTSFEKGLIEGLTNRGIPVVGVQQTDTDPSQIGWYKQQKPLSSVDNIDEITGQISLVYALTGRNGNFGSRSGGPAVPDTNLPFGGTTTTSTTVP
jgi:Copper transport outer membrane protein, MctB